MKLNLTDSTPKQTGRTFSLTAWERHVDKCQHIINKPKPPPTTSPSVLRGGAVLPPSGGRTRTPLEASRAAAMAGLGRERQQASAHLGGPSRGMQGHMDELVYRGGGGGGSGGFGRSAGRDSRVGQNPETRPMPAARPASTSPST